MEVSQKTKNRVTIGPSIAINNSTPGLIKKKKKKNTNSKNACTPMFIAALFTIGKTWEQPKCSSTDG